MQKHLKHSSPPYDSGSPALDGWALNQGLGNFRTYRFLPDTMAPLSPLNLPKQDCFKLCKPNVLCLRNGVVVGRDRYS